jgi:hypothetical protein
MNQKPSLSDLINETVRELGVRYDGRDEVREGEKLSFRILDEKRTAPGDTQDIADTILTLLATSKIPDVTIAVQRAGGVIVE